MCPRTFYINQSYNNLVINEIHYNPSDSIYSQMLPADTVSGRNFEFIELKNTGDKTIYLKDVAFTKGLNYTFEDVAIPANDFIVLAEDEQRFTEKYGFAATGAFNGKLDNGGEKIWLSDPLGNIIDSIKYDDNLPWDTIPDLGQYSLALINPLADNYDALNWKKQIVDFTPGAENDFCLPLSNNPLVVNNSCYGSNDAFISNNVTGGSPPYTYQWNTGANTASVNNLSPGNYTLQIIDALFCTLYQSFTVTEGAASFQISVNTVNASSNQSNDGVATVLVTGNNGPYSYNWSNGSSSAAINNMPAGNYQLTVSDANNCSLTTQIEIKDDRCYPSIIQTAEPQIASGLFQASNYIRSNGQVQANYDVNFKATQLIELQTNFEVEVGASFEARISDCN